jgi:hypothetical protein
MSLTKAQLARAARLLGRKGGLATAARLTADERSASAKRASDARWEANRTLSDVNKANAEFWRKREGAIE